MSNNTPSGKKPEKTLASSVWRQLRFLSLQLSLKTVYVEKSKLSLNQVLIDHEGILTYDNLETTNMTDNIMN